MLPIAIRSAARTKPLPSAREIIDRRCRACSGTDQRQVPPPAVRRAFGRIPASNALPARRASEAMNIFVLDLDVRRCARYHCDQHVVKMILESAQIACTALNARGFTTPYKSTHGKHPCVLWAGLSFANLQWLLRLAKALNREYRYRFRTSRDHRSAAVIDQIAKLKFESIGLTEFPQAMPERYKVPGDPVQAYRNFYLGEKLQFARWTRRGRPPWIESIATQPPAKENVHLPRR